MTRSLTSLSLLIVLAVVVTLGINAYAFQRLLYQQAHAYNQRAHETLVTSAATALARYIEDRRTVMAEFAQQPALIQTLASDKVAERIRKAEELRHAFGNDSRVYLASSDLDAPSPAALDPTCMTLLRRLQKAELPFFVEYHNIDKANAHFDLVQQVVDASGESKGGFIVVRETPSQLARLLMEAHAPNHFLAVEQTLTSGENVVIATIGEANSDLSPLRINIAYTPWELKSKYRGEEIAVWRNANGWLLALVGLSLCALFGILAFACWRINRSAHNDIQSLVRMFRDIREGAVRVDYPMELAEFNNVFTYLQDSGKKLVQQQQKFKDMGLIDHLSQVHNRRAFEERLAELFKQSTVRAPSSVLMIDIDHFKAVNDQLGHDAGDALIINFAAALKKLVRHSDFLARLGGDEFCVIFSYTPLRQANTLAQRLRSELPRSIPLTKDHQHIVRWTGGISAMAANDKKFDDVLWRADQALLRAKEAGRNQTQSFDPDVGLTKPAH